ncbi:hypothetical protein Nepgr_005353 [Nepenthes gracilis]|uniref:Uncharacterized protein n=1 Tax=Nepenthes gracilis TaxID=150966 RepID=A0AAD3S322_NEPGR|nr:hypothetical protein Nepgr_005353 [Nepenthes gracilis]
MSGSVNSVCSKARDSAFKSKNYGSVMSLDGDAPLVSKDAILQPRMTSVAAELAPAVVIPRIASCPSVLQLLPKQVRGSVASPPRPLDPDVDSDDSPPSISRIIMKYSLDTSNHMEHGSSSPIGLLAASSADSHLDVPEVSYLGMQVAPSQPGFRKPVKSRRNRKSASKDAKISRV